jgi:hypothetical protein
MGIGQRACSDKGKIKRQSIIAELIAVRMLIRQ